MTNIVASSAPFHAGISVSPPLSGGSNIANPHPDYSSLQPDWITMFDTMQGQRHIKTKKTTYLPATSGMRALSKPSNDLADEGLELYNAYIMRAYFPDLVKETVRALAGLMNKDPANIELPDALEDMREQATPNGQSLNELLVHINMLQLKYGRLGLLVDIDATRDIPLLVPYPAPQIINWDDLTITNSMQQMHDGKRSEAIRKTIMVVLNESRYERNTGDKFSWDLVSRYRALTLGETAADIYTTNIERDGTLQNPQMPNLKGKSFDEIPFTFINTTNLTSEPGEVPLINLANLSLAIYRGEADHRSALFMSGQDTLVITGYDISSNDDGNPNDNEKPIIGSGAYLNIPDPEGDAKFIGPESQALSEQRTSLENDYVRAGEEGVKLLSSGAGTEAAETLKIRVAARTATLQTIAMTAAAGLRNALRQAAIVMGADPDKVKVEPNLDFLNEQQNVADLVAFATAKRSGIPISWKSAHNWLRQKDYTEMTWEEERKQITEEDDSGEFDRTDQFMAGQENDPGAQGGQGDQGDQGGQGGQANGADDADANSQ